MKNKIILVLVLLVAVFLAGFLPSYFKAHRLELELRSARWEVQLAQLRDLASLTYFQANQKDYGLASATSTQFFDRTRAVANQAPDANVKGPLEELLRSRDQITAELAKGDPAVLNELQALNAKTRVATQTPLSTPAAQ